MNSEYEKKMGKNLRRLREKNHMTQEQVSAKMQLKNCDVTRSALAKIEVGQRHIYPDEIFLLKELFQSSYDEIFPDSL